MGRNYLTVHVRANHLSLGPRGRYLGDMASPLWLFGLELTRFAPADDAADALASSLTAIEAGGWTLSPYAGPALQPYAGLVLGRLELALAPSAAFRRERASTAEGREAMLRTAAVRVGARAAWRAGPAQVGLEFALSDGLATLDREPLVQGDTTLAIGPTLGFVAPLSDAWHLSARARWPVTVTGQDLSHGLTGALGLEWRASGTR